VAASVTAGLVALLIVVVAAVTVTSYLLVRKTRHKVILQFGTDNEKRLAVPGIM
jgi:uncharacterized protein (UPF0333 family)